MIPFANFKFRGTLFSKIRPFFFRLQAMSVFKIQKFPCSLFTFDLPVDHVIVEV